MKKLSVQTQIRLLAISICFIGVGNLMLTIVLYGQVAEYRELAAFSQGEGSTE